MLNLCQVWKKILIKSEGVYQHTRIQTGIIAPVDYNALARGIEASDEHSAIAESQSSNSYMENEAFAYMTSTPEEVTGRFKEQARVQKQYDMLRAQQEFIDALKQMIALLVKKKMKNPKTEGFSSKSKVKRRRLKTLLSKILKVRTSIMKILNPYLKRKEFQKVEIITWKEWVNLRSVWSYL